MRQRPPAGHHDPQHPQRRVHPVADVVVLRAKHDVAGLLAAQEQLFAPQRFHHAPITHIGGHDSHAHFAQRLVQAAVAHHGGDNALVAPFTRLRRRPRDDGHDAITVHDLAALVDEHAAIAVAIQGDAQVRLVCADFMHQALQMRRTALAVDVRAIRFGGKGVQLGAKARQHLRSHPTCAAIGAVEHDLDTAQRQPLSSVFDKERGVVLGQRSVELCRIARHLDRRPRMQTRLDGFLQRIGELLTRGPEDLDAVVLGRVVRSADHGTDRIAPVLHQPCQAGRGDQPAGRDLKAARAQPARQRGLQLGAALAPVVAEQRVRVRVLGAQNLGQRQAQARRRSGGEPAFAGPPPDPVGAKDARTHA